MNSTNKKNMIKFNSRTSKKILILFGILDFLTVLKNYSSIYKLIFPNHEFNWISIVYLLIYISLLLSGYLLITQNKFGIWISYFQFPLRLFLMIFSFGFLMIINKIFGLQQNGIIILSSILTVLEIGRLIISISIHRDYFK